ncbi:MAG: hypothetical protein JO302_03425 [Candidatus Eremiobacteraeota bacterium]|nr:hypothetical protein [Candidatus Eremiobacteraeota bacterium]
MKQRALATVAAAVLSLGVTAPALADGAASTRNIILLSGATVPFIVNYSRKVREKHEEKKEVARRQDAYRDWFYHKYGYYPTYQQFQQWYVQTYNTNPE